jgi:hypothetical protein
MFCDSCSVIHLFTLGVEGGERSMGIALVPAVRILEEHMFAFDDAACCDGTGTPSFPAATTVA